LNQRTYAFLQYVQQYSDVDRGVLLGPIVAITNGQAEAIEPRSVAAKLQELVASTRLRKSMI
jgi:hypothetical protein